MRFFDKEDEEIYIVNDDQLLFVSGDQINNDDIVEGRSAIYNGERNAFQLKFVAGETNTFRIYNAVKNKYLIVSPTILNGDNVVEAISDPTDERTLFKFTATDFSEDQLLNTKGYIKNCTTNKFLFLSSDIKNGDRVLEAKLATEKRSCFMLIRKSIVKDIIDSILIGTVKGLKVSLPLAALKLIISRSPNIIIEDLRKAITTSVGAHTGYRVWERPEVSVCISTVHEQMIWMRERIRELENRILLVPHMHV